MATLRSGARTDGDAVKDILDTELTASELIPFVNIASYAVDDIADAAAVTISTERLTEIETWLAAHRATVRDPRHKSEELESWSAEYLRETSYGETAMALDPTGILSGTGYIDVRTPDSKGIR